MPTISKFYGITIYMNQIAKEHNPPHIHILHDGYRASVDIQNFVVIEGKIKNTAYRLTVEFIKKYQNDLMEMWITGVIKKLKPLD